MTCGSCSLCRITGIQKQGDNDRGEGPPITWKTKGSEESQGNHSVALVTPEDLQSNVALVKVNFSLILKTLEALEVDEPPEAWC
jgi:hypothetical protein